jgi:hypothetical protein
VPQSKSNHVVLRNEAPEGRKPSTLSTVAIVLLLRDEGASEAFKVGASKEI